MLLLSQRSTIFRTFSIRSLRIFFLKTSDDAAAAAEISGRYGLNVSKSHDGIFFHATNAEEFLAPFIREFTLPVLTISMSRPTLNDVFLKITGREIRDEALSSGDIWRNQMRRHMGRS